MPIDTSIENAQMSDQNVDRLDDILKKTKDKRWSPLPDELDALIDTFLPTNPPDIRSKGYVVLSAA